MIARGAILAATTLALALSSSTAVFAEDAKFDPNASITIGSLYEPQNLDNTAGAGQGINEAFNGNVYEALFTLTDAGDVQPGLVAEQSVSEDGLTYTFKLRPGVTFHSGDPLTATDVKYSIERVTAEQSKSSRKKSLATISAIGLLAIGARRTFSRLTFQGPVVRLLPAVSALVILAFGIAMTVRALPHLT